MPKNILIFADGTGQIGGVRPDQRLSNVYKLFRATRPGPDSPIRYHEQVAYCDPGLGAGESDGVTGSKIRSLLESAVGAGIEDNMIDCYEKIISYYEEGDRIILIGFSRGAYTVRALANMMNLCGVPVHTEDRLPVPKSGPLLRQIATEAVKDVYSHGTGKPRGENPYFWQREEKGRRFRVKYGSTATDGSDNKRGNVEPHFVGVFDTVAALQNAAIISIIRLVFVALLPLLVASIYWSWHWFWPLFFGGAWALAAFGLIKTIKSQYKRFEPNPERPLRWWNPCHWKAIFKNRHRAKWDKEYYDRWLSPKVTFARHALAIDEDRSDFPRVEWGMASEPNECDEQGRKRLEQVWFAGCHSDVGGSYLEAESRLSDIALQWMADELRHCIPSLKMRCDQLVTNPDACGLQHEEEFMFDNWGIRISWPRKYRYVDPKADLHGSVHTRLEAAAVPQPHKIAPYRPPQLQSHDETKSIVGGEL